MIAALIAGAIEAQPGTSVTTTRAKTMASNFVTATTAAPAQSRGDIPRLTQAISASLGAGEEKNEVIARSLAEVCQTRTWNLMIDIIGQSGRCPPGATTLSQFVVEGEKRYWLHVAIDRFTGQIIDQQLEAVYE